MKQVLERSVAFAGEAINPQLAIKMIGEFSKFFPGTTDSYLVGRDILAALMAQKGCHGIRFYNAINEGDSQTIVYVAVNWTGGLLEPESVVSDKGEIKRVLPIVADRARPGTPGTGSLSEEDGVSWGLPE